jgi:prepilin-type processing-associated H-X9-DG protein
MMIDFERDRAIGCPRQNRRLGGLIVGSILILSASTEPARGQNSQTSEPAVRSRAAPLARYVPREDLFFLLEFDGLDAHADAWHRSSAFKLLTGTKLGALLEDLAAQGIEQFQAASPPEKRLKPATIIDPIKYILKHGFVVGLCRKAPGKPKLVIVVRQGDRPDVRRLLQPLIGPALSADKPPASGVRKAGRTMVPLDQEGTVLWAENGDLVITELPDLVMAVLDGRAQSARDHPVRTALAKTDNGFEAVARAFLDFAGLPPLPPAAVNLGLDGVKRLELRWGFQDEALMSVIGVVAPAPRRRLLALLDQPTFAANELTTLPAGLSGFAILSADVPKTYEQIIELVKLLNPSRRAAIVNFEEQTARHLGVDLRRDVLGHLGPKLAFYVQATDAAGFNNPTAAMLRQFSGFTLSVEVRDQAAVAKALETIVKAINPALNAQAQARAGGNPGGGRPAPAPSQFRKLDGPGTAFVLDLPPNPQIPQLSALFQPTVMLSANQLVVAATTSAAEHAVAEDQRWRSAEAFVPVVRRLPKNLVFLSLSDPRESLPELIERLPAYAQQLNGLMMPAILSAREAARRAQCTNNLKQIALGLHNYETASGAYPKSAITDKEGKPLLSWRVAILPYIEQQTLYQKFKLDEPWDSAHNKALLKEMPLAYACPSRADSESFTTPYQVFTGKGTMFEDGRGMKRAEITDGWPNTILVAEAEVTVPWTKPDDLRFDPAAARPLSATGSAHQGGFNVVMADDSVHFIAGTLDRNTFRSLITRNAADLPITAQLPNAPPPANQRLAGEGFHIDPDKVPRANDLRRLLFPASMALSVDRQGANIVFRDPIPSISSPATSGIMIGLLLPAVQAAREAARRTQCVNNFKLIGLAMANYESSTGAFPAPAITDKQGKPLLSWRVAILPYLEQGTLYQKFKLDEPWDSPHNRALLKEMPPVYLCPSRAGVEPFTTTYQVFAGQGAVFEKGRGAKLAEITDGTANTIVVVEARNAVPWTKPDDLSFDPAAAPSLFGAGSTHPGGFNVLLADGSARFVSMSVDLKVFRSLITRGGNDFVPQGEFRR